MADFYSNSVIRDVKKGEFFKLTRKVFPGNITEPGSTVWIRDYYCPSEKAYWCYKADDINSGRFFKSSVSVFVSFEY